MVNIKETIQKLFDSGISGYRIAKDTGINSSQINKFRSGYSSIDEMAVKNAQLLIDYYERVKNDKKI
ncbi:XRE family transcriptional regulator [Companilactobacillus baiquanensis]|uniref:XRE family transcriptional regulator n=1 Tax=Companilactobacillus baiquanensis TaxID=2486005 RepID=A0ABW1UUT2_9LACO|nr:XRE family transcriptional regulator [Companilactobacillus baiquanensis]